ncbi:hypothetical protein [Methanimicrococcus hacksteinii]|nr:hypothetical protein [Methanimicrococcus sp. At1]
MHLLLFETSVRFANGGTATFRFRFAAAAARPRETRRFEFIQNWNAGY